MCSFFATLLTAEGVVSVYVMLMMSTGVRGPVWVDRELQFVADAGEESQRGEAMFHAAVGHCNDVGGEDAREEVKVFVFVFEDMIV
jgi:hypothetical protein